MSRREWLFLLGGVLIGLALYHLGSIRGIGGGVGVSVGGET